MQKNDKAYAFLLSHRSGSRIFIKRLEVSKRSLHLGTAGIFSTFLITALSFGIINFAGHLELSQISAGSVVSQTAAQPPPINHQTDQIDYSRPTASGDFSLNSGGPEGDLSDGESSELAERLRLIEATADPAYLPTMWAHLGKINNEFGFRRNPFGGRSYEFHAGMDIDGERGDLIVAPAHGTVVRAGWAGGYGNMIEIDHGSGLTTRYGHMSKIESAAGDTVTRGQLIGYVGSTGRSTGPHLHYELRIDERPINPRHFLPPEPTDLSKLAK